MTGWLNLSNQQRRATLEEAARTSAVNAKAIEKDWWVTLVLKVLFEGIYGKYMIFKGGTSLSKCWSLIERFSDDIDIALDAKAFGVEYKKDPTKGDILYTWFPNEAYVETPMEIAAVDPRKTCLEKAFLLHKEFMKTDMNKIRIERMSRHLYDLYRLDKSGVADAALHDRELYAAIIEHRMQFSRLRMLFKGKTNRWILRFTDSRQLTPENE